MNLTISVGLDKIGDALKTATREEKLNLVEIIENDLLSEWDDFEDSDEMKAKVKESFNAYDRGDVVELKDLLKK